MELVNEATWTFHVSHQSLTARASGRFTRYGHLTVFASCHETIRIFTVPEYGAKLPANASNTSAHSAAGTADAEGALPEVP